MSLDDRLKTMRDEVDREIPVPTTLQRRVAEIALQQQRPRRHRPSWPRIRRAFEIGAAVLLLGAVLTVATVRGHRPPSVGEGPGTIPKSPQTTLYVQDGVAVLDMVSENTGWAAAGRMILRTADGGNSWQNRTPPDFPPYPWPVTAFPDEQTGWVAVWNEQSQRPTVFRTNDAGQTWQSATMPIESRGGQNRPVSISFIDAQRGWLMVEPDHGMNSWPGNLFATSDGGATWTEIASTQGGQLPFGGSIGFRNASDGWLVGTPVSTVEKRVFRTSDGGRTWAEQHLSLPSDRQGKLDVVAPPRFFSAQEGVMTVTFVPDSHQATEYATIIYVSHDGGNTWNVSKPVGQGPSSFFNASNGWVWVSEPRNSGSTTPVKGHFERTRDGGQSWVSIAPDDTLTEVLNSGAQVGGFAFRSDKVGFAPLWSPDGTTQLLKSRDGGTSWTVAGTVFKLKR